MSKITRLQADNFKKLTVLDIRPGGGVVPIRGRNAQGKSSTLDAIMAALGGKSVMPGKPVRRGEDEGAIRLELDDGVVILRRFTVDGKGDSIEVTNAEGFKAPSPQKMLDGLYASVAFDPLAFTRLDAPKQLANLRSLVKLDVDVDALERQIAADYDKRRDLNRDLKTAEGQLAQMPKHEGVPAEPVDEAALEGAIANASEVNSQIERRKVNREDFARRLQANRDRVAELEDQIADLEAQRDSYKNAIVEQEQQLAAAEPLPEPVDVTEVQACLRAARQTNEQIGANKRHHAQELLVISLRDQVTKLSTSMDERRTQIAGAIERANMPVPCLSFGDGEVLLNGLPLDQASSAEQLRVSTAIGMATSPKLRVMLVRDGSLLDDEGEKILADLAEQNDFQLWVEAVDASGKVGIVLEDGAVVSINGEAPPEPEAIGAPKRRAKKSAAGGEPETVVEPASGQGEVGGVAPAASPEPELIPGIECDIPDDVDGDIQPDADTAPWDDASVERIAAAVDRAMHMKASVIVRPDDKQEKPAAPVGLFD
jgi:hypothetical protein